MPTPCSTAPVPFQLTARAALAAVAVLASLAGCGTATYEARLAETSQYFSYLNHLNRELQSKPWEASGIAIRLPKVFQDAPKPNDTDPDAMERWQPSFFGEARTGIAGALVADATVKDGTEPCRLFVLSNHDLWLTDESVKLAPDFQNLVLQQMSTAFNLPEMDVSQLKNVKIPVKASYVDKQTFGTTSLHPKEPVLGVDAEIEVFTRTNKDIQTVFVLIVPKGADDRILKKFELALETLKVTSKKPSGAARDESGKTKDGGKKGGAF